MIIRCYLLAGPPVTISEVYIIDKTDAHTLLAN